MQALTRVFGSARHEGHQPVNLSPLRHLDRRAAREGRDFTGKPQTEENDLLPRGNN